MTRRATQTREIPKDLIENTTTPLDKTKTLTMARLQKSKRVTRKGSKQLTDEERASQVASPIRSPSPTIPPGEIDETLTEPGRRAQAFARQIAADEDQENFANMTEEERSIEIQEKRVNMTEEERSIALEKTRLSLGMLPIAIVRQMKANDRKRAERAKQRANTRGSAVPEPLEIDNDTDENDNDSDNDNREDDLFSNDSNDDPDKGGYRDPHYTHGRDNDPDDNNPGDDRDPDDDYTQSTDDKQKKKKNSSKRKNPTSAIRVPSNAHWACLKTPEEGEAVDVLAAIGVEHTIAKFSS